MLDLMTYTIDTPEMSYASTTCITTFEHTYFPGWFQGAWGDDDSVCWAHTERAYSSRHEALSVATAAFNIARQSRHS